jgi:hypothetical protein
MGQRRPPVGDQFAHQDAIDLVEMFARLHHWRRLSQ